MEAAGRLPSTKMSHSTGGWFAASGPDHFSDLEGREVVGIRLRSKKAPKRVKFEVGDCSAIRLKDGRYFYGRILFHTAFGHQPAGGLGVDLF